ncbi:MAG: glycerophosphodiester phosphodiesterase family protein, partial [Anaerolineae bacterium]
MRHDGTRTLNFAHRGARQAAPENTLAAFGRAVDLGADGIELDTLLSQDGALVVCHNFDVDETSNGSGRVHDLPLAALRELDFGGWFDPAFAGTQIPTLDEVFDLVGSR